MRHILTTDTVAEDYRFDEWHDSVEEVFWPLSVPMDEETTDRAAVNHDVCGALELSTVTAAGQSVRCTPAQAACAPTEWVSLGLQLAGPAVLSQDDRECLMRPGEATLFDPSRPYRMDFAEDFSIAVFTLPRTVVQAECGDTRRLTARTIQPTTRVTSAGLSYLRCVAEMSARSGLTDVALSNGAIGIAVSLLREGCGPSGSVAQRHEVHQRAIAFIDLNLHRTTLSPADVATACHVSLRQLYRIFDSEGQAVAETIRQRRLSRARALLETLGADTPVGWVGARVGFASPEGFNRAFREAHGLPPATWRSTRWKDPQSPA